MQKQMKVGIRSSSKRSHAPPPARIWLVKTLAVLVFLYCRLEKRLVHSHCCSPYTMSSPCGLLHMWIRSLLQFGIQHTLEASWIMALKAAMWTQALSFDRHRPKLCGVWYAAVPRGHVPSTSATVYSLSDV